MSDNTRKKKDRISIHGAARTLGIKEEALRYHIGTGHIVLEDGLIDRSCYEMIREQKENHIGFRSFLKQQDRGRFNSRHGQDRNKYIDFLEEREYFGIKIITPQEIFFELPEREDFYILKEDAKVLEEMSESFFLEFGLTEAEKINQIIYQAEGHLIAKTYIERYLAFMEEDTKMYTPTFTEFVRTVFGMPDISELTDADIIAAINKAETTRTRTLLIDFFRYVAEYEDVKYHDMDLKKETKSNPDPAYPYEDYVKMARILFNKDFDKEHELTRKALENPVYIEMWMFLSCHYVCGWRAGDICSRWAYPELQKENVFGINADTLREDILSEKITEETYGKVALYCIKKMEMAYHAPGKTGVGKLRAEIVPELRSFFGKLFLIAEYHHLTSGKGYMTGKRVDDYKNWVMCRNFFGEEMFEVTGRRSISSRRLNKSYLQGIELAARNDGNTMLVAHVIASYARSHANVESTAFYLKDHGLTGESADVVLYMMMQRGVFGASLYHALLLAYPDVFSRLSAAEQTTLMKRIPLSAYELEMTGASLVAADKAAGVLSQGRVEEPTEILRAMYTVAMGRGKAKDPGVFCKKKALGYSCENPTYESCIANLCPHHVFTSDGIPALVSVIKDYQEKADSTGNKKYSFVLRTKILPAFKEVIDVIMREMSEEEKEGTRRLIEEGLYG